VNDRHTTARWGRPTKWTVIRKAAEGGSSDEVSRAWEDLVERYREPVLHAVRYHLHGHPEADAIADDFFSYLFSQNILAKAHEGGGLFRAYMQACIRRYVKNAWRRLEGQGVSIEEGASDAVMFHAESSELERTEETLWAEGVLEHAAEQLRIENPRHAELLFRSCGLPPYKEMNRKELAEEFGITDTNLKQIIFRAKKQLRDLIVAEVAITAEGDEVLGEVGLIRDRLISARPTLFESREDFDTDLEIEDDDEPWSDRAEEHNLSDD
jgi:RNA polymerase sigma factor (sigma-70 family)